MGQGQMWSLALSYISTASALPLFTKCFGWTEREIKKGFLLVLEGGTQERKEMKTVRFRIVK